MSIETTWAQPQEVTFNFTDGQQSFVVPPGVDTINIQAWGAQGGDATGLQTTGIGGLGGFAEGDLAVTPGHMLYIYVGGEGDSSVFGSPGGGGFNGGGDAGPFDSDSPAAARGAGGGASDVWSGGTSLNNRVIVAAGGGGANSLVTEPGGDGGGLPTLPHEPGCPPNADGPGRHDADPIFHPSDGFGPWVTRKRGRVEQKPGRCTAITEREKSFVIP